MQIWESHYISKLTEYRAYKKKIREIEERNHTRRF